MIKKYNDYITIIIMYEQSIPFTAYAFIEPTTLIVTYSLVMNSEENDSEELDNSELKETDSLSDTNEEENNVEDDENSPFENVQIPYLIQISSTVDTIPSVSTMPVMKYLLATPQSNLVKKELLKVDKERCEEIQF